MKYFTYATALRMYDEKLWIELFGFPARSAEDEEIAQEYMDMALAIQCVTEEIVLKLARTAQEITGSKYLCLSGGVALNCVANGKLLREKIYEKIWIQPASGDAGGALGAALAWWYAHNKERIIDSAKPDAMLGSYLGPQFSHDDILYLCKQYKAPYEYLENDEDLYAKVADLIAEGNVIGWFQGRMEYGPRALGNRSILGDPRNPEMQKKLNLKIKYREGFRPFAPSVLEEEISDYFEIDTVSPYMLLVANVQEKLCNPLPDAYAHLSIYERLYFQRSTLPAVTHVDYSARIQSVSKNTNPKYWGLINAFNQRHNCPVIVNTSFNVRSEPIVCTPKDAYICFMRTEMDYLVLNNILFTKIEQPKLKDNQNWRDLYELD